MFPEGSLSPFGGGIAGGVGTFERLGCSRDAAAVRSPYGLSNLAVSRTPDAIDEAIPESVGWCSTAVEPIPVPIPVTAAPSPVEP